MQKLLFLILGFLGVIFLIELSFLVWQKNMLGPSTSSVSLSPSVTPAPLSLPRSSQNKPVIRFVKLSDEFVKQGYVGWQDGDFFYMAKKNDNLFTYPFSFIGIVKKIENKEIDVEAQDANAKTYIIKIELMSKAQVVNKTKNSKADIRPGMKIRVAQIDQNHRNGGSFLVYLIYILQS